MIVLGQSCSTVPDQVIGQNTIKQSIETDAAACCTACFSFGYSCKAFTFYSKKKQGVAKGTCFLKDNTKGSGSCKACTSGTTGGPSPPTPPSSRNKTVATRACLAPHDKYPFCDTTLSVDARVDDLISRLNDSQIPHWLTAREGGGGSPGPGPAAPEIGVPEYDWGVNCIHGVQTTCGVGSDGQPRCPTSFPNPNALGASFNSSMWQEMGAVIGRELRSLWLQGATEASSWSGKPHAGLDCWSPNVNINRDPRWGRNQEVPSEDPYINGMFGAQYTKGLQEGEDKRYLQAVVTLKHWDAYSLEDSDGFTRHNVNAIIDNYTLADTFWPAFRMSVVDGGAKGVMCSYNAINGVPTCASPLLNATLRGNWGFDGYVTSDTGAVNDIGPGEHQYRNTSEGAAAAALKDGGCDIDSGKVYVGSLMSAVGQGLLNQEDLKLALHRTIKLRFELGLFDPIEDQPYWHAPLDAVSTAESQATNLLSTLESMVLLANPGNLLPIPKGQKVALIGPHANAREAMVGNYLGELCPGNTFDCVQSFAAAMNTSNPATTVTAGSGITKSIDGGVAAAVAAAKAADFVVLALGIDESVESESHDRTAVGIPQPQLDLLSAVVAAGKPVAVVLINGGMLELEPIQKLKLPILEAFYPGFHGGEAIATTLYGTNEHLGGKLPFTNYPEGYIDLIKMSDMSMKPSGTAPGRTYKYYSGKPSIPFGYGLSYSTFKLENSTDLEELARHGSTWETSNADHVQGNYSVTITNTGQVTADEVVFAFFHPPQGHSVIRQVFGFERVHLAPGASAVVTFPAAPSMFKTVTSGGDVVVAPGTYKVEFSNGVDQSIFAVVQMVGDAHLLEAFPKV